MKKTMERILVVDDDPEIREGVADVLRQAGYDVDEAKDGKKAIKCIETGSYDLVLTDLNLPKVDGMKVLRHVLDESPDTICIILTGFGTIKGSVEAI
ncbi:MAG: Fis family transcriptional regulator, partial [Nitrospira bacterium SG8_3]